MEILTNIVANLGASLRDFIEMANARFPSWRNTDYGGILNASLERAKKTALDFPREVGRRLLVDTLFARIFFEEIELSYRKRPQAEFAGASLRGIGQEAVGVGVALAMQSRDILAPEHRSVSAMLARGTPIEWYWRNFLMRATGPTGGHDPNFHFSDLERRNFGFMVSDTAMSAGVVNGAAYAENRRLEREKADAVLPEERICGVAIFGDGAASNGLAHGAMNLAKARQLPVLFVILNNQISYRTSPQEQHGGIDLANRGLAYEMPSLTVDGDNVYEVYLGAAILSDFARRAGHPALLHAVTYRRGGHNDSEDAKSYIGDIHDEKFLKYWHSREKDPLYQARTLAESLGHATAEDYEILRATVRAVVDHAHEQALREPEPDPHEARPVFMDPECRVARELAIAHPAGSSSRALSVREALNEAFVEEFNHDPALFMIGEDIARGGAWGVTNGLAEKFGRERIINAPLDEGAIAAFAVGAGLMKTPAIVEEQFGNFFLSNPSPLLTLAATRAYMQKIGVPCVFRFPCGRVPQSNHYHSVKNEAEIAKALGIKVIAFSNARDAKGLMKSAIRDPDPVAVIEDIGLYSARGDVPEGDYYTELCPVVLREGRHLTLVSWGRMVGIALEAADELAKSGIELDVIDLRVLNPFPREFVFASVRKTGSVMILHDDSQFMGFGAEIAAQITESEEFYGLRGRIRRIAAKNTPVPSHGALEDARLPWARDVVAAAREMMEEAQ